MFLAVGRDGDVSAAIKTNTRTKRGPKRIRIIPASKDVVTDRLDTEDGEWV
jgi:hypothetical protein